MRLAPRSLVVVVFAGALASCSSSDSSPTGDGEACKVLDRQVATASDQPQDVVGLDRVRIDEVLLAREDRLRELAKVDRPGASRFTALADLVGQARPLVVERWGEADGVALHDRAMAAKNFRVIPQAFVEAGRRNEASSFLRASSEASWATFRLAAGCHDVAANPERDLSTVPDDDRPPTPLLALDVAAGGRLVRIDGGGAARAIGDEGLRVRLPVLSPDGRTAVARTVTGPNQSERVRTVGLDGTVAGELGPEWDCGGWLGDGATVAGAYQGDGMRFETTTEPGRPLSITGTFCPSPGVEPDQVLVDRGVPEREPAWVAEELAVDGSVTGEYRLPGCAVTSPVANRAASSLAFAATCDDPLDSGIWTAGSSGRLEHLLTCACGVPAFSPDGSWLAYVIVPVDGTGAVDAHIGFARSDGTGAFHLATPRLSFPMWPAAA